MTPMPARIARLAQDAHGRPVPWFVPWIDGKPDFRLVGPGKIEQAVRFHRCFICGDALGRWLTFPIGPMCTVSRTTPEPPSHKECALYSAQVCPFLTRPAMRRREAGLPEGCDPSKGAGYAIKRNPGVVAVWTTRSFKPFGDGKGGVLFQVGEPTEVLWLCEGRTATREEVLESMESGLPLLRGFSEQMCTPEQLPGELAALDAAHRAALAFVPA